MIQEIHFEKGKIYKLLCKLKDKKIRNERETLQCIPPKKTPKKPKTMDYKTIVNN